MFNKLIEIFSRKRKLDSYLKETLTDIASKSPGDIPVLNIIIARDPVATLFYDKKEEKYGLIYHKKYKNYKGLILFNIDLPRNELVEIGKTYYSSELWYPFSARIPSKSRADCIKELEEHNLTLEDHPLKILNHIGRVSIANRWKLEPFNP